MSKMSAEDSKQLLLAMGLKNIQVEKPGEDVRCLHYSSRGVFLATAHLLNGVLHVRRDPFAEDMTSDHSWHRGLQEEIYPLSAYLNLCAHFALSQGLYHG